MVGKTTKEQNPLLPDRMKQADFFVCDIFDAVPKGDMAAMEHPIFSISRKPDTKERLYKNGEQFVKVRPSNRGIATVHDRDILIYCISQVMAALNEGREVKRQMRFKAFELLSATNRRTGGEAYNRLREAFERLSGTRIQTNIITGGEEILDDFGIIDRFRIIRETRDGRMLEIEVTLSDWMFNAIESKEVLTLSRDYFRLRKPLERRLYEIARKHCGTQDRWVIGLAKLKEKCGSYSTDKEFKRMLVNILEENSKHSHIPDYDFHIEGSQFVAVSRGTVPTQVLEAVSIPPLPPEVYDDARGAAPGWDVRMIEQEWRNWCYKEEIEPKRPSSHFVKFCRTWFEKRGRP